MNVNFPLRAVRITETPRVDLLLIADMVMPGSRVLDIGCGDGTLLRILADKQGVDGRGIELSQAGVNSCVAQGLSVIQGDADTDLVYYPDLAFDYAILSQTIQATYSPRSSCASASALWCHFPISAIGGFGPSFCSGAPCRAPTICQTAGMTRPISIFAPSTISSISATALAPK